MPAPLSGSIVGLSKSAIRERAVAFSARWTGQQREAAEKQTFWNDFMRVFGVDRKETGVYEELARRVSTGRHGWIDLLVPGEMAVEHKTSGEDLAKAMDQLLDYMPSLHTTKKPWLLITCDFNRFLWHNLESAEEGIFPLEDLAHNIGLFWWLAKHAHPSESYEDEEAVNLVATGYMATLHDALLATSYDEHALRELMTRILFCLFADDTDIWDRGAFRNYLHLHTREDGSDLGSTLAYIFQILNTPLKLGRTTLMMTSLLSATSTATYLRLSSPYRAVMKRFVPPFLRLVALTGLAFPRPSLALCSKM